MLVIPGPVGKKERKETMGNKALEGSWGRWVHRVHSSSCLASLAIRVTRVPLALEDGTGRRP